MTSHITKEMEARFEDLAYTMMWQSKVAIAAVKVVETRGDEHVEAWRELNDAVKKYKACIEGKKANEPAS